MSSVTGLDYTPVTRYENTHSNDELISLALNSPSDLVKELGLRLHLALCGVYDEEGKPKSDEEEKEFSVTKVKGNVITCPGCYHPFRLIQSLDERT